MVAKSTNTNTDNYDDTAMQDNEIFNEVSRVVKVRQRFRDSGSNVSSNSKKSKASRLYSTVRDKVMKKKAHGAGKVPESIQEEAPIEMRSMIEPVRKSVDYSQVDLIETDEMEEEPNYKSKRKQNLTIKQLEAAAAANGVGSPSKSKSKQNKPGLSITKSMYDRSPKQRRFTYKKNLDESINLKRELEKEFEKELNNSANIDNTDEDVSQNKKTPKSIKIIHHKDKQKGQTNQKDSDKKRISVKLKEKKVGDRSLKKKSKLKAEDLNSLDDIDLDPHMLDSPIPYYTKSTFNPQLLDFVITGGIQLRGKEKTLIEGSIVNKQEDNLNNKSISILVDDQNRLDRTQTRRIDNNDKIKGKGNSMLPSFEVGNVEKNMEHLSKTKSQEYSEIIKTGKLETWTSGDKEINDPKQDSGSNLMIIATNRDGNAEELKTQGLILSSMIGDTEVMRTQNDQTQFLQKNPVNRSINQRREDILVPKKNNIKPELEPKTKKNHNLIRRKTQTSIHPSSSEILAPSKVAQKKNFEKEQLGNLEEENQLYEDSEDQKVKANQILKAAAPFDLRRENKFENENQGLKNRNLNYTSFEFKSNDKNQNEQKLSNTMKERFANTSVDFGKDYANVRSRYLDDYKEGVELRKNRDIQVKHNNVQVVVPRIRGMSDEKQPNLNEDSLEFELKKAGIQKRGRRNSKSPVYQRLYEESKQREIVLKEKQGLVEKHESKKWMKHMNREDKNVLCKFDLCRYSERSQPRI